MVSVDVILVFGLVTMCLDSEDNAQDFHWVEKWSLKMVQTNPKSKLSHKI